MYFQNYSFGKMLIFECVAGLLLEHPSEVKVLTGSKHCRSLQKQTFILRFHHSYLDKAGKGPS